MRERGSDYHIEKSPPLCFSTLIMPEEEFEQPPFIRRAQQRRTWLWIRNLGIMVGLLGLAIYALAPDWTAALFSSPVDRSQTRLLPDDPLGIKYLSLEGTKHTFINKTDGRRLLVVTGLVKNYYAAPRTGIRVQGRVMDSKGQVLDQQQVYAGTWLDREAVESLTPLDIQNTLEAESAAAGSLIDSGHSIPFQVVFFHVSDAFAGYALDVAGSKIAD